jgi:type IV secretory pathway TraG/TraD family ATPase VirD4
VIGKIGRHLVAAKPRESVVVCGPPGSGKTSAFAIPNLLEWDGPAVVCSVTSEILSTTLVVRSSHGRMAWVYDPAGSVEGVIRIGWNPVPACVDFQKATRLAHHLVSLSDLMQVTQGDFWQSAASDLLGPLLHAAAIGHRGIEDVMAWLSDPRASQAQGQGGSVVAFGTPLALLDGAHGSEDAKTAARTLRGATVGTAAETMLSFCTTARVALKVFSTRAGIASTRQQPGIDFDRLIDSDDTIYIVGTEDVQSELRPIFVGLIDALIVRVGERVQQGRRASKPLLLLLDEAANSAPLTDLPKYAATLRSRDVQLVTIFQDFGQVVNRWGRDHARSILSNHITRVLLPGMADTELLEDFSKLIGERRVVTRTVSHGPGGQSTSETHRWERLAPVEELRTLPQDTAIVVYKNHPAARVRLRPYYDHVPWKELGGWLDRATKASPDELESTS